MKTIFISCFHGYISRNILATDALRILASREDIRVVIFVPREKTDFFIKRFSGLPSHPGSHSYEVVEEDGRGANQMQGSHTLTGAGGPRIAIEGVPFGPPSNYSFLSLCAKRVAKFGLNSSSTQIERRIKWKQEGKFFYFLCTSTLAFALSRSRMLRCLMRFFDYAASPKKRYATYFAKYHPDLLFITDMQNERDVELAHNARRCGVRIYGMVRSWDNLTLHGLLRFLPETLLVTAPAVRDSAMQYNDMSSEHIRVVGIPHYDKYLRGPEMTKEDFFAREGLNPAKKTCFWAPISDYYLPKNDIDSFVFHLLGSLPYQVLVRFSPSLEVKALENTAAYANMRIDRPGIKLGDAGAEMRQEDDERLMQELAFSDVIICGPSTLALDAMVYDKPVILVDFHPSPQPYLQSVARRYDYDHFRAAVATGGVTLARSEKELRDLIDDAIKNPSRNREGRERLHQLYIGSRDGKSGMRLAEALLQGLGI